jgi:hypothetical protein
MAFMTPVYSNERGESYLVPADYVGDMGDDEEIEASYNGPWFCRLSASGYMDATEWDGPYDTLEDAKTAIIDAWDVDPDTGDELLDVI